MSDPINTPEPTEVIEEEDLLHNLEEDLISNRSFLKERGFFSGILDLPKDRMPWFVTLGLILVAYSISFWVRLEWIDFAQATYENDAGEVVFVHPEMVKDGVALPNTHDSFYFGSIVQKASYGEHQDNHLIPGVFVNGMITALPYWILKIYPDLSIEQLLLWLPVYVAGFVCIPIVLIGRLYGCSFWGFFAACLAGITHSYYNRTLAGYYDTDMFSITAPAFSLFFLLAASRKESIGYLCAATVSLLVGCFFYGSVQAITCSLALVFLCYRLFIFGLDYLSREEGKSFWEVSNLKFTIATIFCMSWVLYADTWFSGMVVQESAGKSLSSLLPPILIFLAFYYVSKKAKTDSREGPFVDEKKIIRYFAWACMPILFLLLIGIPPFLSTGPYGSTWTKITGKLRSYSVVGQSDAVQSGQKRYSLKFLDVTTTIREASEVPKEVVRNRILSDLPTCSCSGCLPAEEKETVTLISASIIGFFGLALLLLRYWEFCLCLPFLAIAYYCFKGSVGLRFTVHVGNVASIGITFLLLFLIWLLLRWLIFRVSKVTTSIKYDENSLKYGSWASIACAFPVVAFIASPNVKHAQKYHSHVVYPTKTIEVLDALNHSSSPEDFVVTWWDYGSGCWYYGGLRSFTSPAHQTYDNYLTSEILRSNSPLQAAKLARLKTETFVELQEEAELGKPSFGTAVQAIFKDGQSDSVFYRGLLEDLGKPDFPLPVKTRDMYLFLPYEILRIFPTILSFSSRNLYFPKDPSSSSTRHPPITILRNARREGASIVFDGGFRLNRRGDLQLDDQKRVLPYSQVLQTQGNGKAPKPVGNLYFEGLSIPVNVNPAGSFQLLFVSETNELVILSSDAVRSIFVRRFLLDKFDFQAYRHPSFEKGANPVRQPYMVQADWFSRTSDQVKLYMRGRPEPFLVGDLKSNVAKINGSNEELSFSYHRRLHDPKTGKLIKLPSKLSPNARFHLIQSNLPVFFRGNSYTVPKGGASITQIANSFGLNLNLLSSKLGEDPSYKFLEGEKVEIPARGYNMREAWFFMDAEAFESVLIQGFLMEGLPNDLYEKVYSTAWGKVYRINQ